MHQYFYRSLEVHAVDRCRIRQIPAGSTVGWCWRGLSGGFRYHHEDPTAICRISWFEYASHIHLLAVVVLCLSCNCINCLLSCWELSVRLVRFELRLAPHSRGLRFFWVWGLATWQHFKLFCLGSTWQCHAVTCDNMRHHATWSWLSQVWSHMFQTAHRWAHFPPEELSWWKTALQNMLILNHERQDLRFKVWNLQNSDFLGYSGYSGSSHHWRLCLSNGHGDMII